VEGVIVMGRGRERGKEGGGGWVEGEGGGGVRGGADREEEKHSWEDRGWPSQLGKKVCSRQHLHPAAGNRVGFFRERKELAKSWTEKNEGTETRGGCGEERGGILLRSSQKMVSRGLR